MITPGRLLLYQKLIAELDDEIARLLHTLPSATALTFQAVLQHMRTINGPTR